MFTLNCARSVRFGGNLQINFVYDYRGIANGSVERIDFSQSSYAFPVSVLILCGLADSAWQVYMRVCVCVYIYMKQDI